MTEHNDNGSEVGHAVREARSAAGVTLARLAEMTGLSESYVWRIEKGQRTPARDAAVKIARALDIPPERLGFTDAEAERGTPSPVSTDIVSAIMGDGRLTARQKTALVTVYYSYVEG